MPKEVKWTEIARLLVGCTVLTTALGMLAFRMRPCDDKKCESFGEWINGGRLTAATMLVGAGAGVAFGFLDNCFLFLGMSSLDSVFRMLPYGDDSRVLAGYGNAFSSTISAFASTFVGRLIADMAGVSIDDAPLWAMATGLLVGGMAGIAVPRLLLGPER